MPRGDVEAAPADLSVGVAPHADGPPSADAELTRPVNLSPRTRLGVLVALAAGLLGTLLYCVLLSSSIGQVREAVALPPVLTAADGARATVDEVHSDGRMISVRGWALIENRPARIWDLRVVVQSGSDQQSVVVPTALERRPDVTAAMAAEGFADQGQNYDISGFVARFPVSQLRGVPEDYHVFVVYQTDGLNYLMDPGATLAPKASE